MKENNSVEFIVRFVENKFGEFEQREGYETI